MEDFKRLIKLVREERVSLFIGSGFSIKAGAPSVHDLCEAILSEFDNDHDKQEHKNDSLSDLSNYFVEEVCGGSRNSLIDLLQKKFSFTPSNLEDHQLLAQIPHFHNIFTTNYDTLLEDIYDKDDVQVIRKDEDCAYIDHTKPVSIYKLHGDFNNQDFVVITSTDYKNYFKKNQNQSMWDIVKSTFVSNHILFIGYSLEDDNIISIIKTISKTINKNQKDMFLIAPGLDSRKQGQLKKMKVHYYDTVAADFLSKLTKELMNNIWNDFKHHKVDPKTFSRFCHLHNINPDISLQEKEDNRIVQYKSMDGKGLKHQIDIKMPPRYEELFKDIDFERNGVFIKNSPFPQLPVLKIEKEDIIEFSLRVNGILIKDTVDSVLLAPVTHKKTLTIRIPSRSFIEKVEATIYNLRRGKGVLEFGCDLYNVKVELSMNNPDDVDAGFVANMSFPFKEKYTNNNEAIKWIDVLCALYNNEDIYINELTKESITSHITGLPNKQQCKQLYDNHKRYYENIRLIEIDTGISFIPLSC